VCFCGLQLAGVFAEGRRLAWPVHDLDAQRPAAAGVTVMVRRSSRPRQRSVLVYATGTYSKSRASSWPNSAGVFSLTEDVERAPSAQVSGVIADGGQGVGSDDRTGAPGSPSKQASARRAARECVTQRNSSGRYLGRRPATDRRIFCGCYLGQLAAHPSRRNPDSGITSPTRRHSS
jgi:hypothetical protein